MKLTLLQDHHPNFDDLYAELGKKYDLEMVGDNYYKVPRSVNLTEWKTYKLGRYYFSKPLSGVELGDFAIVKDFSQFKCLVAIEKCKFDKVPFLITIQNITWLNTMIGDGIMKTYSQWIGKDTPIVSQTKDGMIAEKYFDNVHYVPLAIKEKKKVKEFKNKNTINVLCVAKLDQDRKDQVSLITALNHLPVNIKLTLVGSLKEKNKHYNKLLEKSLFSNLDITIKPNLNKKELEKEYLKADLFVLSSYNEPANYSVLEAMSYGLPVICSDTNGTRCYLANNDYVFESRDTTSLFLYLSKMIVQSNYKINWRRLKSIGAKNLALVKKNHKVSVVAKQYTDIIDKTMEIKQ